MLWNVAWFACNHACLETEIADKLAVLLSGLICSGYEWELLNSKLANNSAPIWSLLE